MFLKTIFIDIETGSWEIKFLKRENKVVYI